MADVNSNGGQPLIKYGSWSDDSECDDLVIIWFDPADASNEEYEEMKKRFGVIIGRWRIFTDDDTCQTFVIDPNRRLDHILLVVSRTSNSELLTPKILDLYWVLGAATYCSHSIIENNSDESERKNDCKLLGEFVEFEKLLGAFEERISTFRLNSVNIAWPMFSTTNSSFKDLSHENATFLWTHLLLQNLLHIPYNKQAFDVMIEFCGIYYSNNQTRMEEIEKFSKAFTSDQAVSWYTRDSFIYRLINRALRSQEIQTIFIFAPFIANLHKQLVSLHREFLEVGAPDLLTVYRGQQMQDNEIRKLCENIGGIIAMNTFFSTSLNRQLSRMFAQASQGFTAVLYEIVIDTNIPAAPFSDVNEHSLMPGELEILFSVDAIFRVESVIEINDENGCFQLVKLHLINERTEQPLAELIDYFKHKYIGSESSMISFVSLLQHMGDFKNANHFLLLMLKMLPTDDSRLAVVYDQLATLNIYDQNIPVETLFQTALDIYTSADPPFPNRQVLIATTLTNMVCYYTSTGDVEKAGEFIQRVLDLETTSPPMMNKDSIHEYALGNYINATAILYKTGDVSRALTQYKKVLALCEHLLPSVHPILTVVHEHLGVGYGQLGNTNEAFCHHEKSHKIRLQIYPGSHPELGRSHSNLGWRYLDLSNYKVAQAHFMRALSIHEQNQENTNPAGFLNTLTGLAAVCRRQGQLVDALRYLKRASILVQSKKHIDTNEIDQQMGRLLVELGQYEEAHEILQQALRKYVESKDMLQVAELEFTIGQLYSKREMFECALECFQRALDVRRKFTRDAVPAIAKILHEIGTVYCHLQQYEQALEQLRYCLALELKSLPKNHIDIARSHNSIATVLWLHKDYHQASKEAERAVQIALQSLEESDPLVTVFRQSMILIQQSLDSKNDIHLVTQKPDSVD